jgi:thiamine biosynthesis lipoprotein ApbE
MVMGAARGIDLVNQMENVECLIITRDDGDRLQDHVSQGFRIAN